jgi:hypothetical protein
LLSSFKHSGVPEDSKSQLFQVLGFTPTLGQSRGATPWLTLGSMLTRHYVHLYRDWNFNLLRLVFNHLFTTFLNPLVNNSLSSYSNSLSKVAFNFSMDFGGWPSHSTTVMSRIQKIRVFTTSSQMFLLSQCSSTSPPPFIQILWGFLLIICLALVLESLSFFTILWVALATFSHFTKSIDAY